MIPRLAVAIFGLFLLTIAATSLRWDVRLTTAAGAAAGLLWVAVAWWTGDLAPAPLAAELLMLAAATALSHALIRRAGQLRLSSIRDNLTELVNRAHFEERLTSELLRAARYRRPLTVALLDLDNFKQVNDTLGHLTGDVLLREVADRLRSSVRRTDLVARFGGDEFAILLPETDGPEAQAKLHEVLAIVDRTVRVRDRLEITVTASAGMAVAPVDGRDAVSILAAADARLMAAKRAGRNRLVAAT